MGHTWLEALHPQVACIFNALSLALTANTESVSNKVLSTHTHSYTLPHTYAWSIAHLIHLTQTFSFIYRIILRVAFCFLFWFSSFFFFGRLMTSCFCSNAHSFRRSLHMCVGDVCMCVCVCSQLTPTCGGGSLNVFGMLPGSTPLFLVTR